MDTVPEDERTFFLMSGQFSNDLSILNKLLWFYLNPVSGHEILARANHVASMMMVKLISGRIYEASSTIQKHYSPLHQRYKDDLDKDAQENLKKIKKYFSGDNIVKTVRHKFSFHSDADAMKQGYAAFPQDEILVDFLAEHRGHCLYASGDMVSVFGMHAVIGGTLQESIDRIATEASEVSRWIQEFVLGFNLVFMKKYVLQTVGDLAQHKITLPDGPPIDTVTVPYFCALPLRTDPL